MPPLPLAASFSAPSARADRSEASSLLPSSEVTRLARASQSRASPEEVEAGGAASAAKERAERAFFFFSRVF